MQFEMENKRRNWTAKRKVVGADTKLGHRYSNAIEQSQNLDQLNRSHKITLREIAALEMAELIGGDL